MPDPKFEPHGYAAFGPEGVVCETYVYTESGAWEALWHLASSCDEIPTVPFDPASDEESRAEMVAAGYTVRPVRIVPVEVG